MRNYVKELRRYNPNTIVIVNCGMYDVGSIFERIHVYLDTCKIAITYEFMPLICLNTCFLKGKYGGQLMSSVEKDDNN